MFWSDLQVLWGKLLCVSVDLGYSLQRFCWLLMLFRGFRCDVCSASGIGHENLCSSKNCLRQGSCPVFLRRKCS